MCAKSLPEMVAELGRAYEDMCLLTSEILVTLENEELIFKTQVAAWNKRFGKIVRYEETQK